VSDRAAAAPKAMSEFRQDPVTGRWVIIAAARNARPWHINLVSDQKRAEPCPFCAGNESMTPPEVWAERDSNTEANSPGWRVRVVPNKYPALENSSEHFGKKDGFYQSMHGAGVHEVIIESPEHIVSMSALSKQQFVNILSAYRARFSTLENDRRWRYLLIYKNHGERAGATFEHVHSQLVALPFVPREAQDEIDGLHKHFEATCRCIYCDIIQRESEQGERLVSESDRFVALCPFAPRFGYEIWILPKNHASNFDQSSDADIAALAESLRTCTAKLNLVIENAPFNFVIHTAPNEESADQRYHWHMEILPQITRAAGFEWGTGMHMNSVAPEDAARLLRDGAL
jgi:UDPglucose--hexose-1-phosphate uridylyltransferase